MHRQQLFVLSCGKLVRQHQRNQLEYLETSNLKPYFLVEIGERVAIADSQHPDTPAAAMSLEEVFLFLKHFVPVQLELELKVILDSEAR